MLHWLEETIDKIIIKNINANVFFEIKYSLSVGISFYRKFHLFHFIIIILTNSIYYI